MEIITWILERIHRPERKKQKFKAFEEQRKQFFIFYRQGAAT